MYAKLSNSKRSCCRVTLSRLQLPGIVLLKAGVNPPITTTHRVKLATN